MSPPAGAAVVGFGAVAVVAGAVVDFGAAAVAAALVVVAAPDAVVALVPAVVVAPAVVAAVAPAAVVPGVSPGADGDAPAPGDPDEPVPEAALVSSVDEVEGSAPIWGTASVCPLAVAAVQAAARMPADVATAIAFARMLTRRTFRYGWRWGASRPRARHR